jgi:hypothetical protein
MSAAPGSSSTLEPVRPFAFMYFSIQPQEYWPTEGMVRPMQTMFLDSRLATAHCAAPIVEGSGPSLVETMFGDSKHSDAAQADAIDITPSSE